MIESIFYKIFIDPVLSDLRIATSKLLSAQLNIIDVACGTGSLAFELSKKAKSVTGIDTSESMIKTANQTKNKLGIQNVVFQFVDATDLSLFKTNEFDIATISLALHQFDTQTGLQMLKELKRIARKTLIVDYTYPLPANYYKQLTWFIEWMAGGDHYRNFRTYQEIGGIDAYLKLLNLQVIKTAHIGKSIFSLVLCK